MSAINPIILNEVVTAEPVGKTLTALASPGSKYLPCDGLTRNSADWPELAALLANTGTSVGTISTTTVDISNSRPTATVLSSTPNMTPLVGNNGRVFFQVNNLLYVVTDGVLTTTVTLPSSEQLLTMVSYGNVLIAHSATRLHRSLDNGLTWFTFSNTLVLAHTTIRGVAQAFDYNPANGTLIVVNSGVASGQVFRCTDFSSGSPTLTALGVNPGSLTMGTNGLASQIEYRCVFYDSATTTWYVGGGVQGTATSTDWRHFVIQSTNQGTTWTTRFQEPFVTNGNTKRIFHITKTSNGEIVATGLAGRLFHIGSSIATQAYPGGTSTTYTGLFNLAEKGYGYTTTNIVNITPPSTPTTWSNVWGRGARVLATTGDKLYSSGSSAHGLASTASVFTETTIDPTGWAQITFGADHAIGIRNNGTLWAWGVNSASQHGDGLTATKVQPTQIGTDTNWAFAAAGNSFSLAVKTDGTLWGTGLNTSSQLGDGSSVSKSVWTRIGTATNWLRVYAGNAQGWGITTTNQLWAWGANETTNTLLGIGSTALGNVINPTQITNPALSWASVHPGYTTSGGGTSSYVLALTTTGELYYWGRNANAFAGSGTSTSTPTPTRIGTSTWTKIAADAGTNFGIRSDGTLWSWGNANSSHSLGNGSTVSTSSPGQLGTLTNWTDVISTNSSGLALNSLGQLYAWGANGGAGGFSGLTSAVVQSPEPVGLIPVTTELTYSNNANRVWQKVDNELQISIPGALSTSNNLENQSLLRYDGTTQILSPLKLGWIVGTPVAPLSGTTRQIYANRHGLVWYIPNATNLDSVSEINIGTTTTTSTGSFVGFTTKDDTYTYAVIGNSDIFRTPDGITWTKVGINPFGTNSASNIIEAPVFWNNAWWVVGSGSSIYKSTDLQRWELASSALTGVISSVRLFPGADKLLAAGYANNASIATSSNGTNWTTISVGGAPVVNSVAYDGTNFYLATSSGIVRVNESTNTVASIPNTNLPEVGTQQIAYGNSKLVVSSGRHIVQSSDGLTTVQDAFINSRNLGVYSYLPSTPTIGFLQTSGGLYALPASTSGDILVSSDGINFARLTRPASMATFTWASMFISHTGIVIMIDNTNSRIYRTIASDTSTSTFVIPRSVTSDGLQNYVRAKR